MSKSLEDLDDGAADTVPLVSPAAGNPELKQVTLDDYEHPDPWGKGYKELYMICLLLYLSTSSSSRSMGLVALLSKLRRSG